MKARISILAALLAASTYASDIVWDVTSGTNAAASVTANARPVRGALDRIHVYVPAGSTGTVSVIAVSPFGGESVTLASNVATVGERVFVPRIAPTTAAGASAISVTNSGERFVLSGETLRAAISDVSGTNITIRFRAVIKD
jgi:opacity protein-like surface antigen